jgi:hypothetical protein
LLKHNFVPITAAFSCPSGARERETALPPRVHPIDIPHVH